MKVYILTLFLISMTLAGDLKLEGPVTVSGLSSGAFMAAQMHIAYSDTIKGAAIFAGGPYYCAQGQMTTALTTCMSVGGVAIDPLISKIKSYSTAKSDDDYKNIQGNKVYIFDGISDRTVNPKVGKAGQDLYEKIGADVKTEYSLNAGHGMPTTSYGTSCSGTASPYINNCKYDGAYEALNWLYGGNLQKGSSYVKTNIKKVAQSAPSGSSLDSTAYAYVPTQCAKGGCAIHVVYHGCVQTIADIKMQYVENTGYNEVAEANGIVLIYPQAKKSTFLPSNPNGCWDWWGYTNANYATKSGVQMSATFKLISGFKDGSIEFEDVYDEVQEVLKNESE